MERENTVFIPQTTYIYRVVHRVMEGDCQCEHGPMPVTVGPLYADVYPVTNAQYYQFVQDSGYRPEDDRGYLRHWVDGCYKPEDADKPVVWVSLEDARAYAAFYGKRLPKDYEWQYLAAGDECLEWPWGNSPDYSRANVYSHGLTSVDAFPQGVSPTGCMDMCGNCWEMVDEFHFDGSHYFQLLRGGSFYRAHHYWHAEGGPQKNNTHLKMQFLGGAMSRNATVGFRCVKEGD